MVKGTHMRVTKKLLLGSVIATAALALAACAPQTAPSGGATEESGGPAEITVGIVTSETGPLAGYGKQYLDGFKAGLDYATDGTDEVAGTKIVVEYKDDAGDPDKAVTAAARSSSARASPSSAAVHPRVSPSLWPSRPRRTRCSSSRGPRRPMRSPV